MARIFGVTGGFGVGKSTFCRFLQDFGGIWIDADALTHDLYKPGKPGYEKIRGYFGEEYVSPKKGVLRTKLRRVVLKNPQKLWILNKLIHPLITSGVNKKVVQYMRSEAKHASIKQPIFIEAFYFEKNDLGKFVDEIILIERDPKLVLKTRKKEEKWNDEDIRRFMKLQPIYPRPARVIINSGTMKNLKAEAKKVYDRIITYGSV